MDVLTLSPKYRSTFRILDLYLFPDKYKGPIQERELNQTSAVKTLVNFKRRRKLH